MRKSRTANLEELAHDLDDPVDPGALSDLAAWLDSYAVPGPPPGAAAGLIGRLRGHAPAAPRRRFRDGGLAPWTLQGYLAHLWASARLLRWPWWVATAAAALLGLLLAPQLARYELSVTLLAPPLVIGGVVYSFRAAGPGSRSVELSCAIHPAALILTRLFVVAGWVVGLGAVAALPLLAEWAAAVLFFGGATLCVTYWAGPRSALLATLSLWLTVEMAGAGPDPQVAGGVWMPAAMAAAGLLLIAVGVQAGARLGRG